MKVIILAGGWGSRLGQQTELIPKPMVQIGDMPILWHIMKIYSYYNINDFIVSCGVKANIIKDFFINYDFYMNDFTVDVRKNSFQSYDINKKENWKVTLANTGQNTLKGARIKRVAGYLEDDINMITYGDGVADINVNNLIEYHKSHGKILTVTGVTPPARFGELIEKNGTLESFSEKPQVSSGMINGGFMVFNKNLLKHLSTDENCDFEYGVIEKLTNDGQVMVYKHEGQWACMDHERDVINLNNLWNEKKAFWKLWD